MYNNKHFLENGDYSAQRGQQRHYTLQEPYDPQSVSRDLLFWLEVSVDNAQLVQVVQGQGQLCQIELDIFLGEHHLK